MVQSYWDITYNLTIAPIVAIIVLIQGMGGKMQVSVDVSKCTLKLTANNDIDEDELIRVNYVVANFKEWYQFWKKSPTIKLIMAGDKNEYLKTIEISF